MRINKDSLQKALSDPNVLLAVRSVPQKLILGRENKTLVLHPANQYHWIITIAGHGEEIELTSDCPFPTREEAAKCGMAFLGCLRSKFEPVVR